MRSALQARLLRVLKQKVHESLGGTETMRADIRIVAALNKPLADLVQAGTFRQDFYYRVNVVRIALPPLRERREDNPLLVDHFVARFNRLREREVLGVAPETLGVLNETLLAAHRMPLARSKDPRAVGAIASIMEMGMLARWPLRIVY